MPSAGPHNDLDAAVAGPADLPQAQSLVEGVRAEVRRYKRKIDRRLRGFIQEGIEDGTIARCDPMIAAFSIAGALNWICHWYEPDGAMSPEEIASQFARTLSQGIIRRNSLKSKESTQ